MNERSEIAQRTTETSHVMEKHFVTFYSPGTFVAEVTMKDIASWDVEKAQKMAAKIEERYGATPYGFRFSTRGRGPDDFDSRELRSSGMYYLNGRIRTLAQVKARKFPRENILICNMESNGWDKIVEKKPEAPGWMWTQPLQAGDVVLP
jgi:hypothetical protein